MELKKNDRCLPVGFWVINILGLFLGILMCAFYVIYFSEGPYNEYIMAKTQSLDDIIKYATVGSIAFIQLILLLWGYYKSFTKEQKNRPGLALYIVMSGASLHAGGFICGFLSEGKPAENLISIGAGAAVVLLAPLLIFVVEFGFKVFFTSTGQLLFKAGSQKSGVLFLSKALKFSPSRYDLMEKKVLLLYDAVEYDQAEELYFEILKNGSPGDALLKEALKVLVKREKYHDAINCLRRLLEIFPNDANLKKLLADALIKTEQYDEGISILEKIGDFNNTDFLNRLMRLYLSTKNVKQAVEICSRFAKLEKKPYRQSISAINDIRKEFPDYIEAIKLLISLERENSSVVNVARNLEELLKIDPKDEEARNELIKTYNQTMQYGKLCVHLDFVLNNFNETADILFNYAETLFNLQYIDKSITTLLKGKEKYPDDYRFPYHLAQIYFEQNKFVEAMDEIVHAFNIAPNDKKNSVSILKNNIHDKYKDIEIDELKKHSDDDPSSLERRINLAETLVQHGMIERAASEIDDFITKNPEQKDLMLEFLEELVTKTEKNYLLLHYLADTYFKDNIFTKAIVHYQTLANQAHDPTAKLLEIAQKILLKDDMFVPAHRILADIAEKEGNFENMAKHLEIVVSNTENPDHNLVQSLFNLYYGLGETDKSYKYCKMVLEKDPDNIVNNKKMILLSKEKKELGAAFEKVTDMRNKYPEDLELRNLEVEVDHAIKRSRMDEIIERIRAYGDDSELYEEYGDLAFYFNEINNAILNYQKAAKYAQHPEFPKAKLALCLSSKRMFELAAETLQEIKLTTNPDMTEELYLSMLDIYYKAVLRFEEAGHRQEAVKFYKEIFRVDAGYKDVVEKIEKLSF